MLNYAYPNIHFIKKLACHFVWALNFAVWSYVFIFICAKVQAQQTQPNLETNTTISVKTFVSSKLEAAESKLKSTKVWTGIEETRTKLSNFKTEVQTSYNQIMTKLSAHHKKRTHSLLGQFSDAYGLSTGPFRFMNPPKKAVPNSLKIQSNDMEIPSHKPGTYLSPKQVVQTDTYQKLANYNQIKEYVRVNKPKKEHGKAQYFLVHMRKRLPKYEALFKEAAHAHQLDWRLVAAIAYQESLWNPNAISPTGVKGIMMLTRTTAKEMGVKDRTNYKESINGGTAYFKKIHKRLPSTIQEPDRTLMALAAYNAGYGHLIDARKLTKKQGGRYTKWADVKKRLPLLQNPKYYKKTRYGYSLGARQAIHYVAQVQDFYELLLLSTEDINHPKKANKKSPAVKKAFQIAMHHTKN